MTLQHNSADRLQNAFAASARERIQEISAGLRMASVKPAEWPATGDHLASLAQEIAGQGASFGYPLMSQIGRSLQTLLKTLTIADPRGLRIAVTHVAALHTVLENDIKGHGGVAGAALLARLRASRI